MVELPPEVWLYISEFIPNPDLHALIGVNRPFFNIGMARRYGEITMDTGDQKAGRCLTRISEPTNARRIKQLRLHLNPIIGALPNQEPLGHGSRIYFVERILTVLNRVIPHRSLSQPPTPNPESLIEVGDMIGKLVALFPLMTNIEDFRIVTWALPSTYNLHDFYVTAWSAFGKNLRSISLCANMEGYRVLIDSNPLFPNLETLELEFSDNLFSVDSTEAATLKTVLVPFVNQFCPQVKALKIRSWAKLDLSSFFLDVGPFPALETTLIRIPFNYALKEDPSGFRSFLLTSSTTLRKVAVRLTPTGLALDPAAEEPLLQWLSSVISDPRCFAKARALDICPTNLMNGMDVLFKAIRNSVDHLTQFTVRDRYLKRDEVLALCTALKACEQLTYIRLNVWHLSVDIFDSFAANLPHVVRLWLSIGGPALVEPSTLTSLETFRNDLKDRQYKDWNLWDVTIWQSGSEIGGDTMVAIAHSIPSVRSFWGAGHMDLTVLLHGK